MTTYLSPEQSAKKRAQRTDAASGQFQEARELANKHGLQLRQCDEIHYQLRPRDRTWLLNIYPSNRRMYHDPHNPGPFLRMKDDWTLLDVVKAAIGAELEADTAKAIRRGHQP